MIENVLGVTAIVIFFIALWVFCSQSARDGEWHPTGGANDKMRRWVDGKWQYRDMTGPEAAEQQAHESW